MAPLHAIMRADASISLGGGHVRRCMVLAEALCEAGWAVTFAVRQGTLEAASFLTRSGLPLILLHQDDEATELHQHASGGCDLLVVDHYGLDGTFEHACRGWARRILVLDDLANRWHDCDVLVDQTPGRQERAYADVVPGHCMILAGSAYALLDNRFRRAREHRRLPTDNIGRVLVNFGSTDPSGATALAIEAISLANLNLPTDIVVGSATPDFARITSLAESLSPPARVHVDVDDMATLMQCADIALGGAGISSLERCCLGLPSLIVIVAENQRQNAEALARMGAAVLTGPISSLTAVEIARAFLELAQNVQQRKVISEAAFGLTDGLGASRVRLSCYRPLRAKDTCVVALRPASLADAELMLTWQSAPGIRAFSNNPDAPDAAYHEKWLTEKLNDPDCIFNIILHGGEPAGVLRFDRSSASNSYEVSILIEKARQGIGIGRTALELGKRLLPLSELRAVVRSDNFASARMFKRAGYTRVDQRTWILKPGTLVQQTVRAT